jgi:hypothetical protein
MRMNAADIAKSMLTLGTTVHDAYSKTQVGGSRVGLDTFLRNLDINKLGSTTTNLVNALTTADISGAVAEVDAKQAALLRGRDLSALSVEELTQYSALSRFRLVLTTQNLQDAMTPKFLNWLVDDALPTLVQIAPVVIPLLL